MGGTLLWIPFWEFARETIAGKLGEWTLGRAISGIVCYVLWDVNDMAWLSLF